MNPPNPRLLKTTIYIISAGKAVLEMAGDIINAVHGFHLPSYAVTIGTKELSMKYTTAIRLPLEVASV